MPDIDRHCARINRSAASLGLKATMAADEIVALAREGAKKFAPDAALYVKPMYWAEADGPSTIMADPEFDALLPLPLRGAAAGAGRLVDDEVALPPPDARIDADRFQGRLPLSEQRPALREARPRGFDNALVCDALGNVAETTTANVFMAKDGVVHTPAPNGTFLNGITRQRVIQLLRDDGVDGRSKATLRYEDFAEADEIFISGNYAKVMPVLRIDERDLQPGPFYRKARELYWDFRARRRPPECGSRRRLAAGARSRGLCPRPRRRASRRQGRRRSISNSSSPPTARARSTTTSCACSARAGPTR